MAICSPNVIIIEIKRNLFLKISRDKGKAYYDLTPIRIAILPNTSDVKSMVCHGIACLIVIIWKIRKVIPIMNPNVTIKAPLPSEKTPSSNGRGGRRITFLSAGSMVRARPGRLSQRRFIHRIFIGSNGSGNPKKGAKNISQSVLAFEVNE